METVRVAVPAEAPAITTGLVEPKPDVYNPIFVQKWGGGAQSKLQLSSTSLTFPPTPYGGISPTQTIWAQEIPFGRSRLSVAGRHPPTGVPLPFRGAVIAVSLAGVLSLVFVVQAFAAGQDHDMATDMAAHMKMTALRPVQPGDQQRADAVAAAARKVMDRYTDYRKALADGYAIFLPGVKQSVYHFYHSADLYRNTVHFDPDRPAALLYVKLPSPGPRYKLMGVMYVAPFTASEDELNQRIPLSIARWHAHINLCVPPNGLNVNPEQPGQQFGLRGLIATADACKAAGGSFLPHLSGWMVHVYPYETDPAKIWGIGMGMNLDDEHMPPGAMDSEMPM